jgi:hypothetical protein
VSPEVQSARKFNNGINYHFFCRRCGRRPDAPMLKDELWEQASLAVPRDPTDHQHDLLCTACVEHAIKRQLTVHDLKDVLGNNFTFLLYRRITGESLEPAS